jgi:hypothetical protein
LHAQTRYKNLEETGDDFELHVKAFAKMDGFDKLFFAELQVGYDYDVDRIGPQNTLYIGKRAQQPLAEELSGVGHFLWVRGYDAADLVWVVRIFIDRINQSFRLAIPANDRHPLS